MRRRQDILFLGPALFRYQKERNEENMQFMIKAHDGENMLEKRMEVRPRHLENMAKVNGKVICAGGLLDDGGKMKGSVLIMDFDSKALLDEYLNSEPYIKEGVWKKVEVEHMNVVIVDGKKVGK